MARIIHVFATPAERDQFVAGVSDPELRLVSKEDIDTFAEAVFEDRRASVDEIVVHRVAP